MRVRRRVGPESLETMQERSERFYSITPTNVGDRSRHGPLREPAPINCVKEKAGSFRSGRQIREIGISAAFGLNATGHRRFCLGLRVGGRRWRWGDWRGGGGRFRRPLGRRRRLLWRRWGRPSTKREKPRWRLKARSWGPGAQRAAPLRWKVATIEF